MITLIGIPARRTLPLEFVRALLALEMPDDGAVVFQEGYAVAAQRNQLVFNALDHPEIEAILFLDDDMVMPPDLLLRLQGHQRAIVGALAFGREPPFPPIAGTYDHTAMNPYRPVLPGTGLLPVDYVGTGALLVRMTVFRELEPQWFLHGIVEHQGKPRAIAEDEWFCQAAHKAGYTVFCDTDCVVPHLATVSIDARRAEALRSAWSENGV